MLYLVYGKSQERKDFIQRLIEPLSVNPQHIYDNDLQNSDIHDLVSTQTGLFGDQEVYIIHDLLRNLDLKNLLSSYAESNNIIIFSEASVTKTLLGSFEKYTSEIHDFGKEIIPKKQTFNVFSLADALGKRDKKNLWLLFRDAIQHVSPEEIHGVLFWQIKNLALVKTSLENPGMNPFVYNKNKTFAENFSKTDILKYSSMLVKMFHQRDRYSSLEIELEKMILEL